MPLFFSPTEGRLREGWRLLAHFALLAVLYLSAAIFLAPLLTIPGLAGSFTADFVIGSLAALFGVTASVILARRWFDRRSFASLGLAWNRRALLDLLAGVVIAALTMAAIYGVEVAFGWLRFEGFAWQTESWAAVVGNLLLYLAIYIVVAWQEELLVRGYWLQNLAEGLGTGWGVWISSCLFAVLHALNPNASPMAVLLLVASGVFLASGYLRTRQLWLPIGLHLGWNFCEGPLFGFPVSGTDPFTLVSQASTGHSLLTGGAFGPEAGLIVLPALGLGLLLVYWYTRARSTASVE